jgi:hypothetical protein
MFCASNSPNSIVEPLRSNTYQDIQTMIGCVRFFPPPAASEMAKKRSGHLQQGRTSE